MRNQKRKQALLLLEDGTLFTGKAMGKIGTQGGEICFNTGMTGYQEIYTDPSYFGQIIVNTTSHIGNYGVVSREQESNGPKISGLVVNRFSDIYSRNTADQHLGEYLEKTNIVGISEIDTRKLVRHIRHKGAMNGIISSEIDNRQDLEKELKKVPSMDGLELSTQVSTTKPYIHGTENGGFKVAVLDWGIKTSILKNLELRNCLCQVFPARTKFEEMESWEPDGYFLSNGPGDPASMDYAINTVVKILNADKAIFGICLGHQILALANGIATYKMHNGHRGLNHPVKNLETGLCEVTSQNHGFAVDAEAVNASDKVSVTHINLNDETLEGLKVNGKNAFSVQYHPESSPGPHDSRYLFDKFLDLIKTTKKVTTDEFN